MFAVHRAPDPDLPPDARQSLRRTFAGMGALPDRVLDRCPPHDQVYLDQVAQSDVPAWSTGRVTLVGDAAHAVSLIAGQGASLGVAGAYLLAERVQQAPTVQEGILEYERRWKPVTADVQRAARSRVSEWFLPSSSTRCLLRRWAFRSMRLPGMDRLLIGGLFPKDHRASAALGA